MKKITYFNDILLPYFIISKIFIKSYKIKTLQYIRVREIKEMVEI